MNDRIPTPTLFRAALNGWLEGVLTTWRNTWALERHRYGYDPAAFIGERLLSDFDLRGPQVTQAEGVALGTRVSAAEDECRKLQEQAEIALAQAVKIYMVRGSTGAVCLFTDRDAAIKLISDLEIPNPLMVWRPEYGCAETGELAFKPEPDER